jgi:hypothetical protein
MPVIPTRGIKGQHQVWPPCPNALDESIDDSGNGRLANFPVGIIPKLLQIARRADDKRKAAADL